MVREWSDPIFTQLITSCSISAPETRHTLRWPVPGFSRLFPKYFSLISSLFPISQLFLSYFTFITHFSIISHLFPIYFSFTEDASRFSITLPNFFSVISRLFPSESADISAIYNWLISALTSRRLLHGVTVKSE